MKRTRRMRRSTKIKLFMAFTDAVMKGIGITIFFIGIGAMAECPTDPHIIVRALGLFIGGLCIILWNSYLLDRKERMNDRNKRR